MLDIAFRAIAFLLIASLAALCICYLPAAIAALPVHYGMTLAGFDAEAALSAYVAATWTLALAGGAVCARHSLDML